MAKEYRIFDDRTDTTLFIGSLTQCVAILSQVDEGDEMFPHLWIGALEEGNDEGY